MGLSPDPDEDMNFNFGQTTPCYAIHIKHPDDIRKLDNKGNPSAVKINNWWTNSLYSWVSTRTLLQEVYLANEYSLACRLVKISLTSEAVTDIIRVCHTEVRELLAGKLPQLKTLALKNVQCILDDQCGCEHCTIKRTKNVDQQSPSENDFTKLNDTNVVVTKEETGEVGIQVTGTQSFLVPGENIIQQQNVMHTFPFSCKIGINLRTVLLSDFSARKDHINYLLCEIQTLKVVKFCNVVALTEKEITGRPDITLPLRDLTSTIESLHLEFDKNALQEYGSYPSSMSLAMFCSIKNFPNLSKQTFVGLLDNAETTRHFTGTTSPAESACITLASTEVTVDLIAALLRKFGNETLVHIKNVKLQDAAEVFNKLTNNNDLSIDWHLSNGTTVTAVVGIDKSNCQESEVKSSPGNTGSYTIEKARTCTIEFVTSYRDWPLYSFANNNVAIQHAEGIDLLRRLDVEPRQSHLNQKHSFYQPVHITTVSRKRRFSKIIKDALRKDIKIHPNKAENQNQGLPLSIIIAENDESLLEDINDCSRKHSQSLLFLVSEENKSTSRKEMFDGHVAKVVFTTSDTYIQDMDRALVELVLHKIELVAVQLKLQLDNYQQNRIDVCSSEAKDESQRVITNDEISEIIVEMKEVLLIISNLYDDLGVKKPAMFSNLDVATYKDLEQFGKYVSGALIEENIEIGFGTGLDAVYFYMDTELPDNKHAVIRNRIADIAKKTGTNINYMIGTMSPKPQPYAYVGAKVGGVVEGTLTSFAENAVSGDDKLYAVLSRHVADLNGRDGSGNILLKFEGNAIGKVKQPLPSSDVDVAIAEIDDEYKVRCQTGIKDDAGNVTQCEQCVFDGRTERSFIRKQVFINGAFTSPGYGVLKQVDRAFGTNLCFLVISDSRILPPGVNEGQPFSVQGDSGALVLAFNLKNGEKTLYTLGILIGRDQTHNGPVQQYIAIRFPDGLAHLSNHHGANFQLCQ